MWDEYNTHWYGVNVGEAVRDMFYARLDNPKISALEDKKCDGSTLEIG